MWTSRSSLLLVLVALDGALAAAHGLPWTPWFVNALVAGAMVASIAGVLISPTARCQLAAAAIATLLVIIAQHLTPQATLSIATLLIPTCGIAYVTWYLHGQRESNPTRRVGTVSRHSESSDSARWS